METFNIYKINGTGKNPRVESVISSIYPNSVGLFYSAITSFLGLS